MTRMLFPLGAVPAGWRVLWAFTGGGHNVVRPAMVLAERAA